LAVRPRRRGGVGAYVGAAAPPRAPAGGDLDLTRHE